MTSRSAAERGPGTEAGRALRAKFQRYEFTVGWPEYMDELERGILAIEAEAAAAPPALDWHASVKWEQDRDDPVGMWRCACGATFAPDDLDGYHRHLPRLASADEEGGKP